MKNLFILLAAVVLFMLGGLYFTLWSPTARKQHATEAALQNYADAVDSQDRAKVGAVLAELLTDDAKVHLDVTFSAISAANTRPMSQDFDKAQFLSFMDNTLYTLTDYHTRPKLEEFSLDEDMAAVKTTATQWADGPTYYTGVAMQAHFSGDTQCSGEVVFMDAKAKFRQLSCAVLLRSVANTNSAGETIDKAQQIHDMIQQQQR